MAALHAPTALRAAADVHVEAAHVRSDDGQILLNLDGDARLRQPAVAVRTRLGEGRVDSFVDRVWRLSMRMPPHVGARRAVPADATAAPVPLFEKGAA